MSGRIRALALCLFSHRGRILVNEAHDPVKEFTYCRPIGGGIEFGERAADAIKREILEELGASIQNVRYVGTLENIFMYLGRPEHEIVLVFDGEFQDKGMYERQFLEGNESDGQPFKAEWRELSSFGTTVQLVPEGLTELVRVHHARPSV